MIYAHYFDQLQHMGRLNSTMIYFSILLQVESASTLGQWIMWPLFMCIPKIFNDCYSFHSNEIVVGDVKSHSRKILRCVVLYEGRHIAVIKAFARDSYHS